MNETLADLKSRRDSAREEAHEVHKIYTERLLSEYRVKVDDEIKRGLERIKVEDVRLGEHDEVLIYGRRVTRSGKLSGIYQVVPRGKRWEIEDGRSVYDEA